MKTIFCEKESDWDMIISEIRFLRVLRHPCIIDICDGFIIPQPRMLHIVMQYCETGDLGKVISTAKKTKSSLPEVQVARWSYQISLAMHHIHENG
jgi:NIMA (never in mitosis gene a)-related kinase